MAGRFKRRGFREVQDVESRLRAPRFGLPCNENVSLRPWTLKIGASRDASLHNTCYRTLNLGMAFRRTLLICSLAVCASPAIGQSDSNTSQQQHRASPSAGPAVPVQQSDPSVNWSDSDRQIWAKAKTYVDLPIHDVLAAVPDLKGLVEAENQADLPSLLDRVGKSCLELLRHTPSVTSRETQITSQRAISPTAQGAMVEGELLPTQEKQTFGYLLLSRVTDDGIELREYRTDKKGRPLAYTGSTTGQVSEGFISAWLRLFPANQDQSRFRLLGQQDLDGHKLLVLAFAEAPGRVRFPATFSLDGANLKMLFQGIAWVDATNFRILRLRQDLLAPRPDLQLKQMSVKVRFGEVHLPNASTLWLPQESDVVWEYKNMAGEQKHLYSDFRLYAVHSKILPQ